MIIGNNIASLKKIKASEEALRALQTIQLTKLRLRNDRPSFFLNVHHHYSIMTKKSTMMFYNFLVVLFVKFLANLAGAYKWNSQTQA